MRWLKVSYQSGIELTRHECLTCHEVKNPLDFCLVEIDETGNKQWICDDCYERWRERDV